jgi:hypothetical protein
MAGSQLPGLPSRLRPIVFWGVVPSPTATYLYNSVGVAPIPLTILLNTLDALEFVNEIVVVVVLGEPANVETCKILGYNGKFISNADLPTANVVNPNEATP